MASSPSDLITQYLDHDICCFSVTLTISRSGKKEYGWPAPWSSITRDNCRKFIDTNKNGLMIRTGSINGIVVIDADEQKALDAGEPISQEILTQLESTASVIVKSPNGRHFYYAYEGDDIKSIAGALWNGDKQPFIDIRAEGGLITAPPTSYKKNGTTHLYSYIKGSLFQEEGINFLPDTIKAALMKTETDVITEMAAQFSETSDEEKVQDILAALSPTRWDNYSDWLNIGIICFNLGLSLSLWDSFSRQSKSYETNCCARKWTTFRKGQMGIGTLWRMLKQDSPTAWTQLRLKHLNVDAYLNPTHLDMARLFHALYPDDYVNTTNGWYTRQDNNTWKLESGRVPPGMLLRIANSLLPIVEQRQAEALQAAQNAQEGARKEVLAARSQAILKVSVMLRSTQFLTSIQTLLVSSYVRPNEEFLNKIDENKGLLAFTNGVYDLEEGRFRPIQPEDCISRTTGYAFKEESNAVLREKIKVLLYSCFETIENADYLIAQMACLLHGNRLNQEFMFLHGAGANGKSLILNLLHNTLGEYSMEIPTTYFTEGDSGKDAPLPILAKAKGARLLWASEPEPGTVLQIGTIKKLCGGENVTFRTLNKEHITYMPQFCIWMLLNDFPRLPKAVSFESLMRRFRVAPFPFQFKEAEDIKADHHRLIDKTYQMSVQSVEWHQEFVLMLIERLRELRKDDPNTYPMPTPDVKAASSAFIDSNNPIREWLFEHYDMKAGYDDKVKPTELCAHYNAHHPRERIPINRFGHYMSALGFYTKKSNGAIYYRECLKKDAGDPEGGA